MFLFSANCCISKCEILPNEMLNAARKNDSRRRGRDGSNSRARARAHSAVASVRLALTAKKRRRCAFDVGSRARFRVFGATCRRDRCRRRRLSMSGGGGGGSGCGDGGDVDQRNSRLQCDNRRLVFVTINESSPPPPDSTWRARRRANASPTPLQLMKRAFIRRRSACCERKRRGRCCKSRPADKRAAGVDGGRQATTSAPAGDTPLLPANKVSGGGGDARRFKRAFRIFNVFSDWWRLRVRVRARIRQLPSRAEPRAAVSAA